MKFTALVLTTVGSLSLPVAAFYPYIPKWDTPAIKSLATNARIVEAGTAKDVSSRSVTLPLSRIHQSTRLRQRDNKYNIIDAVEPTQKSSAALDQDQYDLTYFASLSFGTSNEEYHMLLDTAASNTWVMSSDCTTMICNMHNTFGKGDSSSLSISGDTFSITYGTGSVNGTVATDDAHFAGFTVPLKFGLADGVSQAFANFALDGIMGFGRGDSAESQTRAPSIIEVLSERSLIDAQVFGIHLGRNANPPVDGELNLGAPNPSRYDGDLQYTNVMDNDRGFWELPIDGASVGGQSFDMSGRSAILDTGTSFVLVPPGDAEKLHALIPEAVLDTADGESYIIPCSTTANIEISFSGRSYSIPPVDWIGGDRSKNSCRSQIIGRQTFGDTQWLVGDVFLKNVYTLYDFEQNRVGFGVKGQSATNAVESTPVTIASGPLPTAAIASPSFGITPLIPASSPVVSEVLIAASTGTGNGQQPSSTGSVTTALPSSGAEQQAAGAPTTPVSSTSAGSAPASSAARRGMLVLRIALGGVIALL